MNPDVVILAQLREALEIDPVHKLGDRGEVTTLYLNGNQLRDLPPEIGQFRSLQTLWLNGNRLIRIPPEIGQLQSLRTLYLYGNNLASLPSEIGNLRNLQVLWLNNNQLENLPAEIGQLQNLQELYISANQLNSLPVELGRLSRLRVLDLRNNQLAALPSGIGGLSGLQLLSLSRNRLATLPSEIGDLRSLQKLNLSSNELTNIPPEIGRIQGLIELHVSDNQISVLPWEIAHLEELKCLIIKNNQLAKLSPELFELGLEPSLDESFPDGRRGGIGLYGNPIQDPPVEILEQGLSSVAKFFRDSIDTMPLNEVKVLLVGDGAAGKTSLLKRLVGEGFDLQESQTHGINLRDWTTEGEEREVTAHFWDFGGQQIMHATHQFFLSKRSIYILVLDSRKDQRADENTEYWLDSIETFGGNSPVLVVINKIDDNPGFEVDQKTLKEKHPGIVGFHRISCTAGTGIDKLRSAIREAFAAVEILQTNWPKTWFEMKRHLEEMEEPFIGMSVYNRLCAERRVPADSYSVLVEFLADLGVVVHFPDFGLRDVYVLEPKWVTEGVYQIITSKLLAEGKGILDLDRLQEILDEARYAGEIHGYLVNLMCKFEVCYRLDAKRVLVPDLLSEGKPDFELDKGEMLCFQIHYGFLPRSIMPRLIVRMHNDIHGDLRWRKGVVLQNRAFQATAVVSCDYTEKQIFIQVVGAQRRSYFGVLRHALAEIHQDFERLDFEERVPLPDNPGASVAYDHLLRQELIGVREFVPEGGLRLYTIQELLGAVHTVDAVKTLVQEVRDMRLELTDQEAGKSEILSFGYNLATGAPMINFDFKNLWKHVTERE